MSALKARPSFSSPADFPEHERQRHTFNLEADPEKETLYLRLAMG
ncbi:MAG: hypothetical protein ACXW27_16340 [Allosphingosinicella sp.]